MWVESITLTNIKCFREQKILFTRNSSTGHKAKPYSWITLLGENGVGKSTLIQALALLLAGPEAAKELLPRPTGWVRDPSKPGKLTAVLHQADTDPGVFGESKVPQILHHRLIAKIKAQKPYDFVRWAVPTLPLLRRCKMSGTENFFLYLLCYRWNTRSSW